MGYHFLRECVDDLKATGQLVTIDEEVDPHLEAAAIQRRVYQAQGPALFFTRVKGCTFPLVANMFGTLDRARFLFRDTLDDVRMLVALKAEGAGAILSRGARRAAGAARAALHMRPLTVRNGPILAHQTTISALPQIQSWPLDGGAFITLPQVYTEDPNQPGPSHSNLGMYRVQLSGGQYERDREVGLHYQIHRGIGAHHAAAIARGEPLKVAISVGGPPALALSAVMPLPEGLPELSFAGALGGRRVRLVKPFAEALPVPAEADFAIVGTVDPSRQLPEGPFGDHLGYYSLAHDFPVLRVERVYHRPGAIWPFTSVGRPPQEDTTFGALIHELTGPIIPTVIPGLHAVHAVDAAGVHPLLLAIASERYVPYAEKRRPQELLTTACAILGQGQLSLAKYLWIAAKEDAPALDIHDVEQFFIQMLERVDWSNDLHFHTRTTIDTLDYSGSGLNAGSKLVIAAAGPKHRDLPREVPGGVRLPDGFGDPRVALPGVVVVQAPRYQDKAVALARFVAAITPADSLGSFPLIVLVDDAEFTSRTLRNFLWVTFTRSNPAADIDGVGAFTHQKHWGCTGPLVIDARIKPQHAPPLEDDAAIERKVDELGAPGRALHGIV